MFETAGGYPFDMPERQVAVLALVRGHENELILIPPGFTPVRRMSPFRLTVHARRGFGGGLPRAKLLDIRLEDDQQYDSNDNGLDDYQNEQDRNDFVHWMSWRRNVTGCASGRLLQRYSSAAFLTNPLFCEYMF